VPDATKVRQGHEQGVKALRCASGARGHRRLGPFLRLRRMWEHDAGTNVPWHALLPTSGLRRAAVSVLTAPSLPEATLGSVVASNYLLEVSIRRTDCRSERTSRTAPRPMGTMPIVLPARGRRVRRTPARRVDAA
jgi:hypothetical protein